MKLDQMNSKIVAQTPDCATCFFSGRKIYLALIRMKKPSKKPQGEDTHFRFFSFLFNKDQLKQHTVKKDMSNYLANLNSWPCKLFLRVCLVGEKVWVLAL